MEALRSDETQQDAPIVTEKQANQTSAAIKLERRRRIEELNEARRLQAELNEF